MKNTLLNRLPLAVGELRAQRNDAGEIIDFLWTDANAFGLAILGIPYEALLGQPMSKLTGVFKGNILHTLLTEAVETGRFVEQVTDIGYKGGPLNGKSFYVGLSPDADTCTLVAHEATYFQTTSDDASGHFLLFRQAVENNPLPTHLCSERGEIIYANPACLSNLDGA